MTRYFLAAAVLAVCIAGNGAAQAQSPAPVAATRDRAFPLLLPIYRRYAVLIQTKGVEGLKQIATPNFRLGDNDHPFVGAPAFTELAKIGYGPGQGFSVTVRRLYISGNTAVVFTEEALTQDDATVKATLKWLWKQTWHKTGAGWRLAAQDRDDATTVPRNETLFTITPHS